MLPSKYVRAVAEKTANLPEKAISIAF